MQGVATCAGCAADALVMSSRTALRCGAPAHACFRAGEPLVQKPLNPVAWTLLYS